MFPKAVEEVSVNTQVINIGRNPPDSERYYLLLSPKVAQGDVDMHVVLEGKTDTFRLIVGRDKVDYRKTYTAEGGGSAGACARCRRWHPPRLTRRASFTSSTRASGNRITRAWWPRTSAAPQGATYLWDGAEVVLQSAWHYYPQDVVISAGGSS